jgi:hypothetical protein
MSESNGMPGGADGGHAHGAHEERDVALGPILLAGGVLLAVTILAFGSMQWLLRHYAEREARLSPAPTPLAATLGRELPPEPRLQSAPVRDLEELRAFEDAVLQSYGWVDRGAGVMRIPIERAIELLAQRGLPARAEK